MRYLLAAVMMFGIGCGGAPEQQQQQPQTASDTVTCTLDGQTLTGVACYAASGGGGAVFGMALQRSTDVFYFQASTIGRGSSTFPEPNNDMARTMNVGMANETTCDGVGSATWTDDGTTFCVTTNAVCEVATATIHTACVPSSMLR